MTQGETEAPTLDAAEPQPGAGSIAPESLRDLLGLYREMLRDGTAPEAIDAVTQGLLAVLGSGPAFATAQAMLSASQATGLMYHDAVATQQRNNIEAMSVMARSIRAILNFQDAWPEADAAEPPQGG